MPHFLRTTSGFLLFWAAALPIAGAEPPGGAKGATLSRQLATPISLSWSNTPLRRALDNLSSAQKLSIVLDRRVDPDQEVRLSLNQEPLGEALKKIAQQLNVGYCQLGPIAYFGPQATARQLRTLAALRLEEVKALPPETIRKCLQLRTSHWEDLAEPQRLLDQLGQEAGMEVIGANNIPHDLWPAANWSLLTWVDRMTLLAAQFDLTFRIEPDGKRVELIPVPAKVALSRTYQAGKQAASIAKRWVKVVPTAQVTAEGTTIRIVGTLEDHELVERSLRGTPTQRTTVTAGKEVYQLSIENAALAKVIDQLAERLNLEFTWDRPALERANISSDQLVSVMVQNASLDDLLRAVFKGTGLTFRRKDSAVSIFPADATPKSP
jgi:hypothetical protein